MPDEKRCCGECAHWKKWESPGTPLGDCVAPVPDCVDGPSFPMTAHEGEDCPCFEWREEARPQFGGAR